MAARSDYLVSLFQVTATNESHVGGNLFTVTQLKQIYQINKRVCVPHVGLLAGGPELVCDPECLWRETNLHGDRRSERETEEQSTRTKLIGCSRLRSCDREMSVPPVGQPARWAAGSRTSLWSTSRRWRCRTSSDTRHRSRRLVWSVATRGSLAGWWFAPGNEPEPKKEENILLKLNI